MRKTVTLTTELLGGYFDELPQTARGWAMEYPDADPETIEAMASGICEVFQGWEFLGQMAGPNALPALSLLSGELSIPETKQHRGGRMTVRFDEKIKTAVVEGYFGCGTFAKNPNKIQTLHI